MAENNLITKRQEKIIEQLGGDVSTLKTNLESERWDVIDALASGGGSGSSGGYNANIAVSLEPGANSYSLIYRKITELNGEFVVGTSAKNMFRQCTSLTKVSSLDTSNTTDMTNMFYQCSELVEISKMDTSKVADMTGAFQSCTKLSDESLNNILEMCINATSYTGTKQLAYLGIIETVATRCTTLSNYQAFLDAGWTTGY